MSNRNTIDLQADIAGGCLCGAIRYEVEKGSVSESGYCHCRTCQRQSGAPVVAFFAVEPERFRYVKGSPAHYRASDFASREFCSTCGTYLIFREDDATATVSVNTASLDDAAPIPPFYHIYNDSRISWFETADDLPRYKRGIE